MSELTFSCSNCTQQIRVASEQAGFVVYCPNCQAELIVPDAEPEPQPEPPQQEGGFQPSPSQQIANVMDQIGMQESPSQILERKVVGSSADMAAPVSPPPQPERPDFVLPQEIVTPTDTTSRPQDTTIIDVPQEIDDIAETEIYDPEELSGNSNLDQGYMQAHAGEVHIDSDIHVYVHENGIPHTHAVAYTYNGVFQPFAEADLQAVAAQEDDRTRAEIESVQPAASAWPCSVFGAMLEARIVDNLPEDLPHVQYPSVMFGSPEKFFPQMRQLQSEMLTIVEQIILCFGDDFQYSLRHYDVYRMAECLNGLDGPLKALYSFILKAQQLPLPKKDPLPQLRDMAISWYHQIRDRLLMLVDRLEERSALTPELAEYSTINVSIVPHGLHKYNLSLKTFPNA